MSQLLFKRPVNALAFVLIILVGVRILVGTESEEGAIERATSNLRAPMTGDGPERPVARIERDESAWNEEAIGAPEVPAMPEPRPVEAPTRPVERSVAGLGAPDEPDASTGGRDGEALENIVVRDNPELLR